MQTPSLEYLLGSLGPSHGCSAGISQPPELPGPVESRFTLLQLSSRPATLLRNLLISETNFKSFPPASWKEGFTASTPLPAHRCAAWVFLAA